MKPFKTLTLLALTAILSCSANGNPIEINDSQAADTLVARQNQAELSGIINGMFKLASDQWAIAKKESDFTKALVEKLGSNNAHYNYIICKPDHTYSFNGVQGTAWDHYEVTVNAETYDVVVGGKGTFTNKGDGGWKNWAFNGVWTRKDNVVTFLDPITGKAHVTGTT